MYSTRALLAIAFFAAVAVVGIAALSWWHWRQSKVDLVALEERLQAKRAADPGHRVEGLTDQELEDVGSWRLGLVRRLRFDPLVEPAPRRRRRARGPSD